MKEDKRVKMKINKNRVRRNGRRIKTKRKEERKFMERVIIKTEVKGSGHLDMKRSFRLQLMQLAYRGTIFCLYHNAARIVF
jgi:hypothetical protein